VWAAAHMRDDWWIFLDALAAREELRLLSWKAVELGEIRYQE